MCFQREAGEAVPGCDGGEEATSKTDFCIEDNGQGTGQGDSQGDSQGDHRNSPQEKNENGLPDLAGYGPTPPEDKLPLKECEGDCDEDTDVSFP